MKKTFGIIFLLLSFSTFAQESQSETKVYKNIFSTTITNLLVNNFQINYERSLNESMALKLSVGVKYKDKINDYKEGVCAEIQFKYYLLSPERKKTFYNIYFSPYVNYRYTKVVTNDYTIHGSVDPYYFWGVKTLIYNSISAGIILGQTFTLGKKVFIDLYLGGGIRKNLDPDKYIEEYNRNLLQEGYSGITGKVGLDIGFKF
jgi:hypothetical protein